MTNLWISSFLSYAVVKVRGLSPSTRFPDLYKRQAIRSVGDFDLILCGKQTTDGDTCLLYTSQAVVVGIGIQKGVQPQHMNGPVRNFARRFERREAGNINILFNEMCIRDRGGRLRKSNGGAQRYPQNGWKPFKACKGRRVLDCERDNSIRYESRA